MEPFIGSAAVRRGEFTRRGLARECRAIYRDVYLRRGVELTARLRARAAWLSTGAPLCGLSAAAVLGAKWLDPRAPAEVLRSDRHVQQGMIARSYQVADDELCLAGSLLVTTPARTAFDIGRGRHPDEAIPIVDALLAATGIGVADIAAIADRYPGHPGVARLRCTLPLCDGGAESPQESRLRLILLRGGLPRPETQIAFPQLRIRVDLGWRQWRVAIEYDGVQHWSDARQRAWDIERIALLEAAGWVVVRISAAMLARPEAVVARVRSRLRASGCPI
ncbi:MAG: DUF559 domain-containing protein [Mycobacterium sp.]